MELEAVTFMKENSLEHLLDIFKDNKVTTLSKIRNLVEMRGEDTMLKLGMKMGDIIELTEAVKGMSPPSPSQAEGPSSVSCLSQKYSKPQSSSRTANTDTHGIQYKRSENSRKKRRARNKERKQCKKVKFQEEEFIKKKEEEESIKVALQRGKDAESQVNLLKLTVAKLRNENQTLLESRSISSRLSAVPLTVRQDKFRFLASKMPKCNNLSTKVVEFPTKEILLGEGTFCKVVVAKFLTLDIPVAVKIGKAKEFSAKSEGCILQRLAGHRCFPFTFGDFHNMLVMELISELKNGKYMSDTVYSEMERDTLSKKIWIEVLYDLLDAVKFMHFCGILHNDIKCDNILIKKNAHAVYPKLTDFGKATHKLNPITYNLSDADREKYNKKHKHLAIELRNVRGSTQSITTDIYSLGYVYHIIGTHKELPNLKELSLVMMSEKPDDRPSHTRINKSLKILSEQM